MTDTAASLAARLIRNFTPAEGRKFDLLQRAGANLDYWDGEP